MVVLVIVGISSWINSTASKNGPFLMVVVHAALSVLVSISIGSIVCVNIMRILECTCSILWTCSDLVWLNIHAWVAVTWISWTTGLHSCLSVQVDAVLFVIVEGRVLRLLLLLPCLKRPTPLLFLINIIWSFLTRAIKVAGCDSELLHVHLRIYDAVVLALLLVWLLRMSLFTFVATFLIVCILVILLVFNLVSRRIHSVWVYLRR